MRWTERQAGVGCAESGPGNGTMLPLPPVDLVRILKKAWNASANARLVVSCSSNSVSELKSTKVKLVNGVSNPKLHS